MPPQALISIRVEKMLSHRAMKSGRAGTDALYSQLW